MAAAAARVDASNATLDAYALLVAVYRDPELPLQMRFDAACKALPFERAKPVQQHNLSGRVTLEMLVSASLDKGASHGSPAGDGGAADAPADQTRADLADGAANRKGARDGN